ncbi:MAG: hypothetical protein ACR2RE_06315 [Geminicoccaceae bacterium]
MADAIEPIAADQVKEAVLALGRSRIDMWPCSVCGAMVGYDIQGGMPFWNPSCKCIYDASYVRAREWQDLADLIDMQTDDMVRAKIMSKLGLRPTEAT